MKNRITAFALILVLALTLFASCADTERPPARALTAAELLDLGNKYLLELNYDKAVVYFTRLLEIEPMNPRGYTGLAEAYMGLGEKERAKEVLEQGLAELPGEAEIAELLETVTVALTSEQPAAAAELLDNGNAHLLRLEFEQAIAVFAELIESHPLEPRGYLGLAEAYIATGDIERAITVLEDGLGRLPGNAEITALLDSILTVPDYITIRGERFSTLLTELDLTGRDLTDEDIAPLRYMRNLTWLELEYNQISDLRPLTGLTNLTWLCIWSNNVSDLRPLAGLINLRELCLYNNPVSDLSPLAGLASLQDLLLTGDYITDYSPVAHVPYVHVVYIDATAD